MTKETLGQFLRSSIKKNKHMKKLMTYGLGLFLIGASVSSCGKYEEGPKFTLLSKKARITNTWNLTKQEQDGVDVTAPAAYYTLTIALNDDGTAKADFTLLGTPSSTSGNWTFSDSKDELILTDATGTQNYTILKLTKTELKLKHLQGNNTIVDTYTAQ